MKVPGGRSLLVALAGGPGPRPRPHQVQATSGARVDDASVFTIGDSQDTDGVVTETQTYLYPLDNTPAMDFRMP